MNFQIAGVIVLKEKTEPVIMKALFILKSWPPDVNPKCAMVDFDEKEISAFEKCFLEYWFFYEIFTEKSHG